MKFHHHSKLNRLLLASAACFLLSISQSPLLAQEPDLSESAPSMAAFRGSDARFFADNKTFATLKRGVSPAEIKGMKDPFLRNLAVSMKKGEYDVKARTGVYEAYETLDTLRNKLKNSGYNQFENPTGIYFTSGDKAVVIVDGALSQYKVELKVHDFGPEHSDKNYPLENGVNIIPLENSGLGYINYYTDDFEKAPKLAIHIPSGKVNGVFNSAVHKNEDWKKMLANAVTSTIDIKGKHVQLAYPIEELKKYAGEKGLELINLYDRIIGFQHEIMGLTKYKKVPKNRIFGRVIWSGFMHADGIGAAFHNGTMVEVGNPDKIPSSAWGISHEFGHVNQTRPGMMWVSTTEVTNNLYSAWANFKLNPKDMRLEHERINGGDGDMIGGRFNSFLNAAIVNEERWLCQKGPDKMEGYEDGGDHFVKLVPLWQLQLYFMAAKKGNPTFLADIFEKIRNESQEGKSNGQLQLEFMKNVADATKQDLSNFFVKTGMLKPIDQDMDDYSRAQLTITEKECKNLISYMKKYKKPISPVIYYMSVNSLDAFTKQLPVTGKLNEGVSGEGTTRKVSHDVWKNVTVFETYKDDELVKVTMVGTDSPDNSSTTVIYPEGSTKIVAVGWDGRRLPVYTQKAN